MKQQYVFVDDSGDPGLKGSNTARFIVAAVVVVGRENLVKLSTAINRFRAELRWDERHEFKFNKTEKIIIKNLLRNVCQFEFESYAVVIDKAKIDGAPKFARDETLYSYAIKELLLKLKLNEPIIVIDGATDKKYVRQMRTYVRQALKSHGVKKCKVGMKDSCEESLVQLADIIAGSVARSYDRKKTDCRDYIRLFESRLEIYEIIL